jgi:glycosyltransferase involved in cell wall biosynthesis
MIKLLYITNGINGAGGLERVLSVKASYLADHYDYEVTILTLNETHPNSFYNFSPKVKLMSIDLFGSSIKYFFKYIKEIKRVVRDVNPDIISVCDDGLKGFFIPTLLKRNKIPIIYERHVSKEIEIQNNYSFLTKVIIKVKWKLMDVLAISFSKFVVLTNGNINEWKDLKNIMVIANPLSFFPQKSSSLTNKKVIAVGKQSYQKGYDLLIKAWAKVSFKFPEWQLEIYGKKESKYELEKLADNLNIRTTVTFFDPEKDIQEKYLEASIYVMSSRYEGFGMVLIEAMACGVPCVSFDCNYGPSDIIQCGVDGLIVENGNCNKMSEAIIALIENENLRIEMGKKAKVNVKRFLPENIAQEWDVLFKKLLIKID